MQNRERRNMSNKYLEKIASAPEYLAMKAMRGTMRSLGRRVTGAAGNGVFHKQLADEFSSKVAPNVLSSKRHVLDSAFVRGVSGVKGTPRIEGPSIQERLAAKKATGHQFTGKHVGFDNPLPSKQVPIQTGTPNPKASMPKGQPTSVAPASAQANDIHGPPRPNILQRAHSHALNLGLTRTHAKIGLGVAGGFVAGKALSNNNDNNQ